MAGECKGCGRLTRGLYCRNCEDKPLLAANAHGMNPANFAAPTARRGVENKTEGRFRRTVLEPMAAAGQVARVEFEPLTFHLHGVGKYTPDFVATLPDNRLHCWEVKGPQRMNDGSVVRLKAHAVARPWIRFTMVQWKDGGWRTLHDLNAPAPGPMDNEPAREG